MNPEIQIQKSFEIKPEGNFHYCFKCCSDALTKGFDFALSSCEKGCQLNGHKQLCENDFGCKVGVQFSSSFYSSFFEENKILSCFQDENVGLVSADLDFNGLVFQMENERELEDEEPETATIILVSWDKFCRKLNENPENKETVNAISSV
eukprot:snap_masked-scaffold_57-processed-gene-1.34-mRNA-1 protein AED:1.00 eAED:1.00 QI:0/0/0/0/1/1/2/0/149